MIIDARLWQPLKALDSIDVRFDVNSTVSKLVHSLNVFSAMEVTPEGITIEIKDLHPSNADGSINLAEDGIVIDVRLPQ